MTSTKGASAGGTRQAIDRLLASGRGKWLGAAAVGLAALAYRDLLTIGTRYSTEAAVENWLMEPNDRAPLIVIALSAWLLYRRWPRLEALEPRAGPAWAVGACFALGAVIYGWAVYTRTDELQALSLLFNASGLVLLRWGAAGLRAIWLPIAFLAFIVPIPTPLVVELLWKLRLWTAEYSGWLLWLLQIPALVSGDQVLRASQAFQVIEGCSGLRSAETLTMLVVLLIDLFERRGWHAAVLILLTPPLAFALNGLRVLTLMLNPHSELAAIHSVQGIAILLVGLLVVYLLDGLIERFAPGSGEGTERRGRDGNRQGSEDPRALGPLFAVGAAMLVLSVTVPEWKRTRHPIPDLNAALDRALPELAWEAIPPDTSYFMGRTAFRRSLHRRYDVGSRDVDLFIGLGSVRERATTPLGPTNERPGSGWRVRTAETLPLAEGGPEVRALMLEKGLQRRLAVQWYEGAKPLLAETFRALLGLERSRFERPPPLLVIRMSTPVPSPSREAFEEALGDPIRRVYGLLEPALDEIRRDATPSPKGQQ